MRMTHDDAEAMPCKPHLPAVEVERLRADRDAKDQMLAAALERESELKDQVQGMFSLIYAIRCAAGDPEGRLMQYQLVDKIREACNAVT